MEDKDKPYISGYISIIKLGLSTQITIKQRGAMVLRVLRFGSKG